METAPTVARENLQVRGERGIGEWFGGAWFVQPTPAEPSKLRKDFSPWLDDQYESRVIPPEHGERIDPLHDRVAQALSRIIRGVDDEYIQAGRGDKEVTILDSGNAAPITASGRALTGQMPDDHDENDFKCFTCGISKFRRQVPGAGEPYYVDDWRGIPEVSLGDGIVSSTVTAAISVKGRREAGISMAMRVLTRASPPPPRLGWGSRRPTEPCMRRLSCETGGAFVSGPWTGGTRVIS